MPTILPLRAQEKHIRPAEVYLRRLAVSDKEKICQWMTSPYILHHSFVIPGPHAIAKDFGSRAYAERYFNLLMTDNHRQTYAILVLDQHIGTIGIKEIDNYQRAECFIEIGELEFRGQGVGRLAMTHLLQIAFDVFSLDHLALDVLEFNIAAIKLYHSLGFVSEENFTWHYDEFGLYWRVIRMNLPKSAWVARRN